MVKTELENDRMHAPAQPPRPSTGWAERWVYAGFPAFALVIGFGRAWASRQSMFIDGVSYVDIADAYARGDWHNAVNLYWNPLYSWLLAAAFKLLHPSPAWEFPVVHLVNFAIYVLALAGFEFFLRQFLGYRARREARDGNEAAVPATIWRALGYTLFLFSSLNLVGIDNVSPDLCIAAAIYLAAGIMIRIAAGEATWKTHFLLGLCLGLCYLAKIATALPVILCFAAGSFSLRAGLQRALFRATGVCLGLALVAGPYVAVLSHRKGQLTASESGKLNYAWFVDGVPQVYWQGQPAGFGRPVHPPTRLFEYPAAFTYDVQAPGTYPLWYDPARWFDGVKPHFDLRRQLYTLQTNLQVLFDIFFGGPQILLVAAVFFLYLLSGKWRQAGRSLAEYWFLWAPAAAGFAMYAVVHVESRFFGAFTTLLWMGLLAGVRMETLPAPRKLLGCVAAAVAAAALLPLVESTALELYQGTPGPTSWDVANGLQHMGIDPGDRVAVVGNGNRCGWARLARVQITAEIPHFAEWDFRTADDRVKSAALEALFGAGVKAVVADHREESGCQTGWQAVGHTGFSVCRAASAAQGNSSPDRGTQGRVL